MAADAGKSTLPVKKKTKNKGGRPKGSTKTALKAGEEQKASQDDEPVKKNKCGRPKGSTKAAMQAREEHKKEQLERKEKAMHWAVIQLKTMSTDESKRDVKGNWKRGVIQSVVEEAKKVHQVDDDVEIKADTIRMRFKRGSINGQRGPTKEKVKLREKRKKEQEERKEKAMQWAVVKLKTLSTDESKRDAEGNFKRGVIQSVIKEAKKVHHVEIKSNTIRMRFKRGSTSGKRGPAPKRNDKRMTSLMLWLYR